ncbi:MAG: N-acetyltransferase [Selenomonadaceae bacterium]|nr:N-acetyltransferase [Selenomonadaceae bacterium]
MSIKRDKKEPLNLEGKTVVLKEIVPEYFSYVVEWRNNSSLNKFLNQPFVLTLELEKKWYEEVYLPDDTQEFFIMTDKETGTPFGTIGRTNIDLKNKVCISGRLILGNSDYALTPAFWESFFVLADYSYTFVDVEYIHVVKENRKAMTLDKTLGFVPNEQEVKFPNECFVNGLDQQELYRTKEMYLKIREKLFDKLVC